MNDNVPTPASCKQRPSVAVLGAGIAGLTAAHELVERGFHVTVYEPREDERVGLGPEPPACYPPVKLGGLAASQYSTVGTRDGSRAQLRPFPGRRGDPRAPDRAVAGEHGFRFFPAYYLHIWDLFQRIPVYQRVEQANGAFDWQPTSRTVMDNVKRVITQGTTVEGQPSLVFPREAPRSLAEFLGTVGQLTGLGFTPSDVDTFISRLVRYLVTSPLRRAEELQNLSAYDYFVGRDNAAGAARFSYTPRFNKYLLEMPRVLAAFDSRWGDARTNVTTYLQLQLQMDRRDNKADGVLNGPTTESWFDHWYRHLRSLGVCFVHGSAASLEAPVYDPDQPPHLRPRVQVVLADGTRLTPDYTVVAVDAPAAENITTALRAAGSGGTVAKLDGFTTSIPPENGPLQPGAARPPGKRDPYAMAEMGVKPWDRFQTLGGIQYYFDTEFQLLRGHMYYSGTEWALSSINQQGLWEKRPALDRDGHVSVLSVDIGDFNTPSEFLLDEHGHGKAARDCTADEIAAEVWRQIVWALTNNVDNAPEELLPWPAWYALDRGLVLEHGSGQGEGRVVKNETPYLVPIVGDWLNRPGGHPWNPHDTSWTLTPREDVWLYDLDQLNVWQARHGGFQVHNNSVVFAGTWTKTFTRMTSMEAACESARHAVNAILDHYVWVESGGVDRRQSTTLRWRFPYGFVDQGFSSPIRMPTPAGDYCYVFDIENREPADTRLLRNLDAEYCLESLPQVLDAPFGSPALPIPPPPGGRTMTMPTDYSQQLLAYLQVWRQFLEQATPMASGVAFPPAPPAMPGVPPAMPGMPPIPGMAPTPPAPDTGSTPPTAPSPLDYTHQLLAYLQAWRHYLEEATGAATGPPPPHVPGSDDDSKEVHRRPVDSLVNRRRPMTGPGSGSDTGLQIAPPSGSQAPGPSTARAAGPSGTQAPTLPGAQAAPFAMRAPETTGPQVPTPPANPPMSSDNPALRANSASATRWPPEILTRPGWPGGSFIDRTFRRPDTAHRTPGQGVGRLTGSPFSGPADRPGLGPSSEVMGQTLYSMTPARPTTSWATRAVRRGVAREASRPEAPDIPVMPRNQWGHAD